MNHWIILHRILEGEYELVLLPHTVDFFRAFNWAIRIVSSYHVVSFIDKHRFLGFHEGLEPNPLSWNDAPGFRWIWFGYYREIPCDIPPWRYSWVHQAIWDPWRVHHGRRPDSSWWVRAEKFFSPSPKTDRDWIWRNPIGLSAIETKSEYILGKI